MTSEPLDDGETAWLDTPNKHHFYRVWRDEDDYYFRKVAPIIDGGFRVYSQRQIADEMEQSFFNDHPMREKPDGWEDAYKDEAWT